MKDFLLSSTIPYWIVFGLVTAAGIIAIMNMRKNTISESSVKLVTLLALAGTVFGLGIYSVVGGNSIWWCISKDYSFLGKLLRVIPLVIFVGIQLCQVFVFKSFVEQYFQKELSIKQAFVSFIVIVPASIILYIVLDVFGLGETARNVIFYIILCLAIIAGTGWSMTLNVKSIGMKYGVVFTAVTLVMIIGGLMSLLLLIAALFALILQVLMVIAIVGGFFYVFNFMTKEATLRDLDGKMHKTISDKEDADFKIRQRRRNSQ